MIDGDIFERHADIRPVGISPDMDPVSGRAAYPDPPQGEVPGTVHVFSGGNPHRIEGGIDNCCVLDGEIVDFMDEESPIGNSDGIGAEEIPDGYVPDRIERKRNSTVIHDPPCINGDVMYVPEPDAVPVPGDMCHTEIDSSRRTLGLQLKTISRTVCNREVIEADPAACLINIYSRIP